MEVGIGGELLEGIAVQDDGDLAGADVIEDEFLELEDASTFVGFVDVGDGGNGVAAFGVELHGDAVGVEDVAGEVGDIDGDGLEEDVFVDLIGEFDEFAAEAAVFFHEGEVVGSE